MKTRSTETRPPPSPADSAPPQGRSVGRGVASLRQQRRRKERTQVKIQQDVAVRGREPASSSHPGTFPRLSFRRRLILFFFFFVLKGFFFSQIRDAVGNDKPAANRLLSVHSTISAAAAAAAAASVHSQNLATKNSFSSSAPLSLFSPLFFSSAGQRSCVSLHRPGCCVLSFFL